MKIDLLITSLGSSGEGIGSLDGLKVFVDGALPGEWVSIEIFEKKKNYALGKLLSILKPSKDRVTPLCPLFGSCGGCQLMHLNLQGQLEAKRKKVQDALERIGHLHFSVPQCISSPKEIHYRNKIQLPLLWKENQALIGLYRKQSHEIIPVDRCYIQCEEGENILSTIRSELKASSLSYVLIRNGIQTQESLILLVTDGSQPKQLQEIGKAIQMKLPDTGVVENIKSKKDNVILGPIFRLLAGKDHFHEKILGKTFRVSAPSFFQVNPWQVENLYRFAIELADLNPTKRVLDAFCGVGTLALFAADKAKEVVGMECVSHAIVDAKNNAKINSTPNCHFYCKHAEEGIRNLGSFDCIFLNPPRKGCETSLLHEICRKKTPSIIYISCDPATLARDLRILCDLGYRLDVVQPFDMFPQTMHVETVAKLTLT